MSDGRKFVSEVRKTDDSLDDDDLSLTGPQLKIRRANRHLAELKRLFDRYIDIHVKRIAAVNRDQAVPAGDYVDPFDETIPTVIGDILHNLKSALDHTYCTAVRVNGGKVTRHTKFPFYQTEREVKSHLSQAKKNKNPPHSNVCRCILDVAKPFDGGEKALYHLHNLNNLDKHKMIIPTVGAFRSGDIFFRDRTGEVNSSFIGSPNIKFNVRSNLQIFGSQNDTENLVLFDIGTRTVEFAGNPYEFFKIEFADDQPLAGKEVWQVLAEMLRDTAVVLSKMHEAMLDGLVECGRVESTMTMEATEDQPKTVIRSANVGGPVVEQVWAKILYDEEHFLPGEK